MNQQTYKTLDGNEAVARIAYLLNEVIAIYPITPASPMGEWADLWSSIGQKNLWGTIPSIVEMQSEGGAAGAVHGALQTGSLATTFTASQGLLLMIPNLYKIAGELSPAVIHIASRSLAAQALSIFGDHSDVMAARGAGWAMLCSASVQEAQDFALIAQVASLESRVPFLHFFDGFRTSHEISKIALLREDVLRQMVPEKRVVEHRARALSPDHPVIRGTSQNPDVYFQAREAVNPYYGLCADAVEKAMAEFARLTGRQYRPFEYHGAPDAERVLVLMGSGCDTATETVEALNAKGEKVGVLKVRLYRPFDAERFVAALPSSVRAIAVLDRTKEPGSAGEPLYLDCVNALHEAGQSQPETAPSAAAPGASWRNGHAPKIVGGRYGLSSKEFTPAMICGVFENLSRPQPRNHFVVGINDDVSKASLPYDPTFSIEPSDVYRAVFYGLGSDGTVGANKDSIKIIGEGTDLFAQGYFVYDSKKSGAMTISHLRFGPRPIQSPYLISEANFVACHQPIFLERFDILKQLAPKGIFLLNTPHPAESVWEGLPPYVQRELLEKQASFHVIDAHRVAREAGMGGRINTVMQVCFFVLSGVLPKETAVEAIHGAIRKTYKKKGPEIVQKNLNAVNSALDHLHEVCLEGRQVTAATAAAAATAPPPSPGAPQSLASHPPAGETPRAAAAAASPSHNGGPPSRIAPAAPEFVRNVLGEIIAGRGDQLPVSALPVDGTYPTGSARWEKRNLAYDIPVWEPDICIQCGKCVFVCPHATIRGKVYSSETLTSAPENFKSCDARHPAWKGLKYSLQVAAEDCTGCGLCVSVCPARDKSAARRKAIHMERQAPLREQERSNWDYFLTLPDAETHRVGPPNVHGIQTREPLFEFSGACAGCGETPYLKLLTQLFGDRLVVANATGCSSIYGGNLPTTPWSANADGRGPAWSNSLFEDNAEFGLGFRMSLDNQQACATEWLRQLAPRLGEDFVQRLLAADQRDEAGVVEQREAVVQLKQRLRDLATPEASRLLAVADALVRKSVWIVGGDGWAYDIGYGGLDHVLASGKNVKVLVLDTEVYSNTGGQCSKATPKGAVAKFAAAGKRLPKKDLGRIAMTYGNIYVASVAMGAKDEHTLKAFVEAEAYQGPALIIAYSHCIAHGIVMGNAMQNQKAAVDSGEWLLYRYNPDRLAQGLNPLQVDSPQPKIKTEAYFTTENRFRMLNQMHPETARDLFRAAQAEALARRGLYDYLSKRPLQSNREEGNPQAGH